jgi:DNA mismatch repair protein MSH5
MFHADHPTVKSFVDPTVILCSAACNEDTIARLDPGARNQTASEDGFTDQMQLPYLLQSRPNAEFGYDSAKNKLVGLNIGQPGGPTLNYTVPGDVITQNDGGQNGNQHLSGRQGALLRLAGWINMDSKLTVGCAGAVLAYLQRRRATSYLPGDRAQEDMFQLSAVQMFTMSDSMFINSDTLLSLQITTTESHPNSQQQGPANNRSRGSKEGLSVYGLFHGLAKTVQGRRLLRQYFLRPSLNLDVINERHSTVSFFLRPDNITVVSQLTVALGAVKDMRAAMINMRKGIVSGVNQSRPIATTTWYSLRQFLYSTLELCDVFNDANGAEGLAIRHKIVENFDQRQIAEIGRIIGEVIDFEASKDKKRTIVREGVNDELDEARRTYYGIDDMLAEVAGHIAHGAPAGLAATLNLMFYPQIGFLICIGHEEHEIPVTFDEHDPWEKMFTSGQQTFYKNSDTAELDQTYGDIYGQVLDMEIEIIQNLAQNVLEYEDAIVRMSDICGELDSLVAFARAAVQYKLVHPHMTSENVLKISEGRHILQELTVQSFVPNDAYLLGGSGDPSAQDPRERPFSQDPRIAGSQHPDAPSVLLMTGPNYSGKSVYLKQVAIIVFLAHIGSFVPAAKAKIGLTDKILTRIATRESVSRIQSAFMLDLQQVSIALSLATRNSLVIIDEFGKGTDSNDGAGLAAAVYEDLLNRGAHCPKVLGATHFHEIFEAGFLPVRPSLDFGHMEVKLAAGDSGDENQITYLYNYRPGRSSTSFGAQCAAMSGIDEQIIDRANDLLMRAARGEDLVEACAKLPDAEMDEFTAAVSSASV